MRAAVTNNRQTVAALGDFGVALASVVCRFSGGRGLFPIQPVQLLQDVVEVVLGRWLVEKCQQSTDMPRHTRWAVRKLGIGMQARAGGFAHGRCTGEKAVMIHRVRSLL